MSCEVEALAFSEAGQVTLRSTDYGSSAPVRPALNFYSESRGSDQARAAGEGVGKGGGEVLVEDVTEDGENIDAEEVDSDPAKVAPTSYTPTQQEADEHNVDHLPPAQLVSILREWVRAGGRSRRWGPGSEMAPGGEL